MCTSFSPRSSVNMPSRVVPSLHSVSWIQKSEPDGREKGMNSYWVLRSIITVSNVLL